MGKITDMIIGTIFIIVFSAMITFGISSMLSHSNSYDLTNSLFIIIIGSLGLFDGAKLLYKRILSYKAGQAGRTHGLSG